jgi:hypothetical protein
MVAYVSNLELLNSRSPGTGLANQPSAMMSSIPRLWHPVLLAVLVALAPACGGSTEYIPGTRVARSNDNEAIVERVEAYRTAVERKDTGALALMAARNYWDDSGTPSGEDDYGWKGLQKILVRRFKQVEQVRYALKYVAIKRQGNRAFVDVLVDASFSLKDSRGQEIRQDMRDQNQMVLEWNGDAWMFVSGM